MPEHPTRTLAAILFTDIAGFTALMQRDEEEALRVQEQFFTILRKIHDAQGGRIVKRLGDGALSIFGSAVEAVQCALDLQEAFRRAPLIPVHIGLHLGDVIHQGDDIVGDGVNVAARLEALAVPGSVLLSGTIHQQVFNQPQFSFKELGAFFLKNVEKPVDIFALANEGLYVPSKEELAAMLPRHDNLPQTLTSFLGREREVQEIRKLLQKNRLLTLTGPGGTGKTRLSLRAVEGFHHAFQDGICWVNLAPVSEPEQVPFAIVQALEIHQDATHSIEEILLHYLGRRRLLLLLDNFEQIIAAAPLVVQILQQCPGVKILVTSRAPLGIPGEWEYQVDPLPLPDPDHPASLHELQAIPSIALFVQRAQAVKRQFQLQAGNARAVAEICIRLDGLPLAIELAAARIKIFPPATLLQRLSKNLDLLKDAYSRRPSRHQTLRQTIAWSYELLDAEEKLLFQRLAVFAGGGTLEGIETVCGRNGLAEWDMVEGVLALVNKSLLRMEEKAEEPRYYMLETIREFAVETLERSPDRNKLREAHAAHYLQLAERAQPFLTGSEQHHWLAVLEADHTNLKTAIQWCKTAGKLSWAFRLGIALLRFWLTRNMLLEARQTLEGLLNYALPDQHLPLRLKLLQGLGAIYMNITDNTKAVPVFEEILAAWTRLGNEEEIAVNQNNLGWALMMIGDGKRAETLTRKALEYHQQTGNLRGQCLSFTNLGGIYLYLLGQPREALTFFERSLSLRERMGDERGIGFVKGLLGACYNRIGAYKKAKKDLEESLAINRSRNDRYLINFNLIYVVEQEFDHWDLEALSPVVAEMEMNNPAAGSPPGLSGLICFFKSIQEAVKAIEDADALLEKGLQIMKEHAIVVHTFLGRQIRGFIWLKYAGPDKALLYFREALRVTYAYDNQIWMTDALEMIGALLTEETAVALLGKADAMRVALDASMPPRNRPYVEGATKRLKEKLGEESFRQAFEKGGRLSEEEAVRLASLS